MSEDKSSGHQQLKQISFSSSQHFNTWLMELNISLAFTNARLGKVFLLGTNSEKSLSLFERSLAMPSAIHYEDNQLFLATAYQLWRFINVLENNTATSDGYDRLFIPRGSSVTGDIGIATLNIDAERQPFFVSSLFSCIATTSYEKSFRTLWTPPFISRLVPENRCFLNGMAVINKKPKYVSAWTRADSKTAWIADFKNQGVVVDVESSEIVCQNLTMPTSLVIHDNKLWLAHSGAGYLGVVDVKHNTFMPVIFCPGVITGLEIINHYAVVALSKTSNHRHQDTELGAQLRKRNIEPWCGIFIIDLTRAKLVHWFKIEGTIKEIADITLIEGSIRPSLIGFQSDQVKTTISIG